MDSSSTDRLHELADRLCDKLTVALCGIESARSEAVSDLARRRLDLAETALREAGEIAWTVITVR